MQYGYQMPGSGVRAMSFAHVKPIESRSNGNFVSDNGAAVINKIVKEKVATVDSLIATQNNNAYAAAGLRTYQSSYHYGSATRYC